MYLERNDDFYRVYKSELRSQTFYISVQHHQTKEKKRSLSPYTLHQFTGTIFITCLFLLEQQPYPTNELFRAVNFNCLFKITTPSGNTVDFNNVNLRRSFTKPSFISITLHPVKNKSKTSA